jgi:hypothetical protein
MDRHQAPSLPTIKSASLSNWCVPMVWMQIAEKWEDVKLSFRGINAPPSLRALQLRRPLLHTMSKRWVAQTPWILKGDSRPIDFHVYLLTIVYLVQGSHLLFVVLLVIGISAPRTASHSPPTSMPRPCLVFNFFLEKHCSTFRLYLTNFVQSWIN